MVCFRKLPVAKKIMDKKVGVGAEYQNFPSSISCLTVPETLVRQTSRVSLNYGLEKIYASEGYVTIFCGKFFVSHGRKNS